MATTTLKPDLDETPTLKSTRRQEGRTTEATGFAREAASQAAARLPDLASGALTAYERANAGVHAASDEMLTLGTAISFGFAVGLLIGGANRLLVGAALVPVAMMGFTLLDRVSAKRVATGSTGTKGL